MADTSELLDDCDKALLTHGYTSTAATMRMAAALKSRLQAEAHAPASVLTPELLNFIAVAWTSWYILTNTFSAPDDCQAARVRLKDAMTKFGMTFHGQTIHEYLDRLTGAPAPAPTTDQIIETLLAFGCDYYGLQRDIADAMQELFARDRQGL